MKLSTSSAERVQSAGSGLKLRATALAAVVPMLLSLLDAMVLVSSAFEMSCSARLLDPSTRWG